MSTPISTTYTDAEVAADAYVAAGETSPYPHNECPTSKRPCGHHCNCSWVHDSCHWCGVEFGEEG